MNRLLVAGFLSAVVILSGALVLMTKETPEEKLILIEGNSVPLAPSSGETELKTATALMGNGCFWCVEADMEKIDGVLEVTSGYAGGTGDNPTYKTYSMTGHREVVEIVYDPARVQYANLVESLIKHGDPTDATGSFYDRGVEYAPIIYYETDAEHRAALDVIAAVDGAGVFDTPLALVVAERVSFWSAEDYHQNYYLKNPIRYAYYRSRSGRDAFIETYWGNRAGEFTFSAKPLVQEPVAIVPNDTMPWISFQKPTADELHALLTPVQFKVTQENGTEEPFENKYDTNTEAGIYVDVVSGEPLFSSRDKYDSGTGWPSFVKPITPESVTLHEDKGFFSTRIEVRSYYADSHLGHVFDDGPVDRGGKRYCMNSAALRFIPKNEMQESGYGAYLEML